MQLRDVLSGLAETVTGMEAVLCVGAGLLAAYWDGWYCERRGWRRDARFVRWAGFGVAAAGGALYLLGVASRYLAG
ncbi:MAG: hypothetical protein IRZ11_01995 [Clostridia bacterium]|nr:hypothetical protein [Clostridia bacterium]